jgi:hypothetical protein
MIEVIHIIQKRLALAVNGKKSRKRFLADARNDTAELGVKGGRVGDSPGESPTLPPPKQN